jgi:Fe(3+) dicitrate transport protein
MKNWLLLLSLVLLGLNLNADDINSSEAKSATLIKVYAPEESSVLPTGSLPSVYKNKIYKGKKAKVTNLVENTQVSEANNTRQVLQESSGVIVSDVNNQSYYSIGIRGIGDPHESQGILLMTDDLPISADLYGYPAAYYLPPMSSVDSIEVTKTGAGLLYGSQPGGSLNYQLKKPKFNSAAEFKTINTLGSEQLLTTYNSVEGGSETTAYRVEAYQRSGAGQFEKNSGFSARGFDARLRYKINEKNEIKPQLSYYKGRFEEAGGLALDPAAGRISIKENLKKNTLQNDELLIDRLDARVSHEFKTDQMLNVTSTLWASNLSRESRRQNGSGFGVVATNNTNSIQDQDFYSGGARVSVAKDYQIAENNNTFTGNVTYYKMDSPLEVGTGATADADTFSTLNRQLKRATDSVSVAVENMFEVGAWAITPALRAENIKQKIDEKFNGTATLRNTNVTDHVVLGGLAVTYSTESDQQIYLNASEGFRPIQFSETVPTSSNTVVNSDLKSSKTLSTELGIKGQISNTDYDISAFSVNYKNQVGTVTSVTNVSLGNVGEAQYQGLDLSAKRKLNNNLSAFANAQFMSARFISGPQDTKTPAYAPGYLHKFGAQHETYKFKNRIASTIAGEHYSDDSNNTERVIPSYNVWDFSGEYISSAKIVGGKAKIMYGINNVLDAKYYSRVRATGIEPSLERNYYAGFELAY